MEFISEWICRNSHEPVDPNLWEFSPQVQLYGPRVLHLKGKGLQRGQTKNVLF